MLVFLSFKYALLLSAYICHIIELCWWANPVHRNFKIKFITACCTVQYIGESRLIFKTAVLIIFTASRRESLLLPLQGKSLLKANVVLKTKIISTLLYVCISKVSWRGGGEGGESGASFSLFDSIQSNFQCPGRMTGSSNAACSQIHSPLLGDKVD